MDAVAGSERVGDIAEKRGAEPVCPWDSAHDATLLKITAALASAVSGEQVFEALVDHVAEAVGASSAALWLVAEDSHTVRLARSRGYSAATVRLLEKLPLDLSPSIPAIDSIRSGEPLWIPSQATLFSRYPHLTKVATPGRAYRVACLPLLAHGVVLGTLALTVEEARESSVEEQEFLLIVARYASQAIERLRLLDAERRSRAAVVAAANRLGVLSRASRAFDDSSLDLASRLHAVAMELEKGLDSCVTVALVEPDGLLRLTALQHPIPEAQALLVTLSASAPLRLGEGVTGSIASTGESMIVPSLDPEMMAARAAPAYREFLERFPVYAIMGAPLRTRGRVIGTVTAVRVRKGESYTVEDLGLLEELAERAAIAIDNARLFEETLAAQRRAEQLYRFAQVVVAADKIETVFDVALAAIETALEADRSAILTFDNEGVMRFRAWRNLSDAYRAAVEGHSPWAHDVVEPVPVLVSDPTHDPAMTAYLPLFRAEGIGALAFIPLVTGGRLIGKFMVYYDRPHAFGAHEVDTARAIANHLASVITRFAMVSRLEETVRSNELFAGVLAHDLRNPLGAMMMAAQLVLMRRADEDSMSDTLSKPLSRILSSGQRMKGMIEQLLDFTRARSGGGIDVEPKQTNFAELCIQAVEELEVANPEWKIERRVIGDGHGTWDPERMLQVLSNLLANAGQHGCHETGITVTLDGTHKERVRLEVHNQGAIPDALMPSLFDPFRGRRQAGNASRGLGLGLFIVCEIVRAHGGTVDVSSSESAGTTFVINLPRHCAPRTPGK